MNGFVNKNNYGIDKFTDSTFIPSSSNVRPQDLHSAREDHLKAAMKECSIPGAILEFGVHKAKSLNLIAETFPDKTVHGFDSFEGLPTDWAISKTKVHKAGHFKLEELPDVKNNVVLWDGWFKDSIDRYLKDNKMQISFLHIDGDLYSSCIDVLYGLNDFIVKGTVIVFDEMYPWGRKDYPNWAQHEFKATQEWVNDFDREFVVLYHSNHQQCSIRVER